MILAILIEFVALQINRRSKSETKPLLVDIRRFGKNLPGIPQVGRTNKMSFLDPHLGYAHDPAWDAAISGEEDALPGFVTYKSPGGMKPIRIIALGGSTTDPLNQKNWPRFLSEILGENNIPNIVYNGGVSGYSSNQEFLKLVRDGLPLNPDIVLSLSGINDLGFLHSVQEHPMVHPYQTRVLESVLGKPNSTLFPNLMTLIQDLRRRSVPKDRQVLGINYGPEVGTTPAEQWAKNIRMMRAVANTFSIEYSCFLQPVLGIGEYTMSEKDDGLWESANKSKGGKYSGMIDSFYDTARKVAEEEKYIHDFTDVFSGMTNLYTDARHPNSKGYIVIAEKIFEEIQNNDITGQIVSERQANEIHWRNQIKRTTLEIRSHEGWPYLLNGSFEDWNDDIPDKWELESGEIFASPNVTDGSRAVQLNPVDRERGTRLFQRRKNSGLSEAKELWMYLDASFTGRGHLSVDVSVRVHGKWTHIGKDPETNNYWIGMDGIGEWKTYSQRIEVPSGADLSEIQVHIMLRKNAKAPCIVDNFSILGI